MLINKFPYQKLSRKNVGNVRHYTCPDGSKVASVTAILAATKEKKDKDALDNWRKRVGYAKAEEISKSASSRGTRMHSFLENYIVNDIIGQPGTNPFSIESHAMANHVIENILSKVTEFYASEANLYFPRLWAGTTDLIGLYEGEIFLGDFKQANRRKEESWIEDYKMQISAYLISHDYLFDTKINRGIIMICTPPPNMLYQQFEIQGLELERYKEKWWKKVEQFYSS